MIIVGIDPEITTGIAMPDVYGKYVNINKTIHFLKTNNMIRYR
jgi:predicted RNase H-like nuclease (RuvC/YqgF family)